MTGWSAFSQWGFFALMCVVVVVVLNWGMTQK